MTLSVSRTFMFCYPCKKITALLVLTIIFLIKICAHIQFFWVLQKRGDFLARPFKSFDMENQYLR